MAQISVYVCVMNCDDVQVGVTVLSPGEMSKAAKKAGLPQTGAQGEVGTCIIHVYR